MNKKEFENKYSNVELYFNSYYKYRFHFVGIAEDGTEIKASIGGGANEIYKLDVNASEPHLVSDQLELHWDDVVAQKDGEEIFEWFDSRW